jgi:hypothetical protein
MPTIIEWRRLNAVRKWIAGLRASDSIQRNLQIARRKRLGRLRSDGTVAHRFDRVALALYSE